MAMGQNEVDEGFRRGATGGVLMGRARGKAVAVLALALPALVLGGAAAVGAGTPFGNDGIAEPGSPSGAPGLGVFDLAPASGGKIVAAIAGVPDRDWFGAARFSGSGRLDPSFGQGGYTTPLKLHGSGRGPVGAHGNSIVPLSGGRVLVGGFQEDGEKGTAPLIARYQADGKLDPSFGHGGLIAPKPASEGVDPDNPGIGGGILLDLTVAGGREIGVGAQNDTAGARPAAMVIAYGSDGRIDKSFGDGGRYLVPARRKDGYTAFGAVEALAGGKLLVAGYLRGRLTVLRLTAAGAPDPGFGNGDGMITVAPAGTEPNCCVATARLLISGGRILVMGRVQRGGVRPLLLARLKSNGELDRSFGQRGRVVGLPDRPETKFFTPRALAIQGHRILVAGPHEVVPFEKGAPVEVTTVVGFRRSGAIDNGFGSEGVETIEPLRESRAISATELSGGRAVIGGTIAGAPQGEPHAGGGFEPLLKLYGGG